MEKQGQLLANLGAAAAAKGAGRADLAVCRSRDSWQGLSLWD